MALNRQLWIAIASVMVIAFVSSLAISFQSARAYFEEQLHLKNIDNANTLALTLSQVEKDPVLIELMIAAQFDTGHYQRLELLDPSGEPIASRTRATDAVGDVPGWFAELAELRVDPGIAQVPDGWQQYGTLYVESLSGFALEALWDTTVELFLWFFGIAAVLGLLGSMVLKSLTRPLDDVVDQAESIGNQRFIATPEPRTLEFRRVVRSMNILSARVRDMLGEERSRLEEMRQRLQRDALTGVGNRGRFDDVLGALLADDDPNRQHGLFLVRLVDLAEINRQLGHQETDALIKDLATRLGAVAGEHRDSFSDEHLARLNGSDFALILTDLLDAKPLAERLTEAMQELAARHAETTAMQTALSAGRFGPGDERSSILIRLDDGLARAEHRETTCLEWATQGEDVDRLHGSDEWRAILHDAIEEQRIHAAHFATRRIDGRLIHREAMLRLEDARQTLTAGQFLPWARRLGLLPQLDLAVAESELERLARTPDPDGEPIALNLSIDTLLDESTRGRLLGLLASHTARAAMVSIELAERAAIDHPAAFREFCAVAVPLGYRVGIEKAGLAVTEIDVLHELGLSYLKLDRSLTTDLAASESNRSYLRGITGMAHAIGLTVIADGVRSAEELTQLGELGVDGASGPGVPE
ncbi:EAL domain-containing protein [Guyparkeria hydrothermalis]|uniref:bifunctional diguanylate cyclase/phosphodiesterase n=1 Tax=Guyparkeria hydrothermalis TaxID=923 RepID=UPI0020204378|nr:LapD/MoxY N-terminal periplasmic domain-containing protein [Guyparkeria hydrothermalis]MCL7751447.1 EAL domain-containing protein [Guyparkeria hydrothermalis]